MKNGTQGFTLIELLIVIAIIGILAAVLIPNLLGARQRAQDAAATACADAALKQAEIYFIDKNTYVDYTVTNAGDYATGSSCATTNIASIGTITASASAVSGSVTSKSGRVVTFSNTAGISKPVAAAPAAPASN